MMLRAWHGMDVHKLPQGLVLVRDLCLVVADNYMMAVIETLHVQSYIARDATYSSGMVKANGLMPLSRILNASIGKLLTAIP